MNKLIALPLVTVLVFAFSGGEARAHVDPQGRPHSHPSLVDDLAAAPGLATALALASGLVGAALALSTLRAARRRAAAGA